MSSQLAGWMRAGWADLVQSIDRHPLWLFLGWQDIRQRYRRSLLGPFWLTISTGLQIGMLGILWATLFGQKSAEYLPYFAVGLVLWTWMGGVMQEACTAFTQFEHVIRQTALPFASYLLRVSLRHLVILAHNFVIVILVLVWRGRLPGMELLLVPPGLLLIALFLLGLSGPVAVLCTRFRDMTQIVANLVNLMYYITPILWMTATLHSLHWIYEFNPLYHLLELVRAPLLGHWPEPADYLWSAGSLAVVWSGTLITLGRSRTRLAYWI